MNNTSGYSAYLEKIINEFEHKNDARLSEIVEKLRVARSEGRITRAVEILVPDLLDADRRNALSDFLEVLPVGEAFSEARRLIAQRIFRAAAHELSQLTATGTWRPSEIQQARLQRFYLYYAE